MATVKKRKLSGSTDGKAIKVVATSTIGTTIHTAVAGTTPGTYDEIWAWASNNHTADVVLTIEFGGAAIENQTIVTILPFKSGPIEIIPGWILQNGLLVTIFASIANVVGITGFVNTITD